jgi:short-subunit dehydrogenase
MKNPTALITGGSQGIGEEFARCLAKDGYNLILVARSKQKLSALAQELSENFPIKVDTIAQDLTLPDAAEKVWQQAQKNTSQIDILINNAGFATAGAFIETSLEEEQSEIDLNVRLLTSLSKLAAQSMVKNRSGKILNVASTAAFLPGPYMAVYYATKAYVYSFSAALAEELSGTGVSVTVLCPGPTKTGFADRAGVEKSTLFSGKILTAAQVAEAGYQGMVHGKRVVIPSLKFKMLPLIARLLPTQVAAHFVAGLQRTARE